MSKKKIKINKKEAWSLGHFYSRECCLENIAQERVKLFLKIKKKHER